MRARFLSGIVMLVGVLLGADQPTAVEKAKLFDSTTHDFGTVPRGAQLLHRFTWSNRDGGRQEVVDLRSSCGCATASALPRVVEPGQKGMIEVLIDAKKFVGQKTVHVQVVISGERPQAATLEITAHSRPDIVYNPGEVNFGVVNVGVASPQSIEIEYAGQLDWRVEELVNQNPYLEARFAEMYRKPGQAGYRVHVTLKPDVPTGDFRHELQLRTNDPTVKVISVLVQGTIRARLMASPSPLCFGTVREQQLVTRRAVIRGDKPFHIVKIEGLPPGMTTTKPSSAAVVQTLAISWTPESAGELNTHLVITTDLATQGSLVIPVQGQVVK